MARNYVQTNYDKMRDDAIGSVLSHPYNVQTETFTGEIKVGYMVLRDDTTKQIINPDGVATVQVGVALATPQLFIDEIIVGSGEQGSTYTELNSPSGANILTDGIVSVVLVDGISISADEDVYFVNSGADAGKFTNSSGGSVAYVGAKFYRPTNINEAYIKIGVK